MIAFIKRHWIAYLVGGVIAVLLGLGMSFFLGAIWSTPADVRAERVAAEQQSMPSYDDLAEDLNESNATSDAGSSEDAAE